MREANMNIVKICLTSSLFVFMAIVHMGRASRPTFWALHSVCSCYLSSISFHITIREQPWQVAQ